MLKTHYIQYSYVIAVYDPDTLEVYTDTGDNICTGVMDEITADREVRDFFDDSSPITSRKVSRAREQSRQEIVAGWAKRRDEIVAGWAKRRDEETHEHD